MAKRILVVCGSPHASSNSDVLAKAFADGAAQGGHAVEVVKLAQRRIGPCMGCDYCRGEGKGECVQRDDMQALYPLLENADAVALATPLYFHMLSAQLKTFIDRLYCKHHAGTIAGKKAVLLSTSGGPGSAMLANYFTGLCNLVKWEEAGTITQGGMGRGGDGPGEAKRAEAFRLGESM